MTDQSWHRCVEAKEPTVETYLKDLRDVANCGYFGEDIIYNFFHGLNTFYKLFTSCISVC